MFKQGIKGRYLHKHATFLWLSLCLAIFLSSLPQKALFDRNILSFQNSCIKPDSFSATDSGTLVFRFRSLFRPLAVRFSAKTQAAEKRQSSKKFFDTIHT